LKHIVYICTYAALIHNVRSRTLFKPPAPDKLRPCL